SPRTGPLGRYTPPTLATLNKHATRAGAIPVTYGRWGPGRVGTSITPASPSSCRGVALPPDARRTAPYWTRSPAAAPPWSLPGKSVAARSVLTSTPTTTTSRSAVWPGRHAHEHRLLRRPLHPDPGG